MQVQDAFIELRQNLSALYDERESDLIAQWVIEHLTGLSRSARLIHKTEDLTTEQESNFQTYRKELLQSRPVQYVLGEAWFSGMKFFVDERVLIPRPETEELVGEVVASRQSPVASHQSPVASHQTTKVLDIGTGSGCIPISLKKKNPGWDVWAVDLSEGALEVASQNAKKLGAEIHFSKVDILDEDSRADLPVFDIIVSNPPYIPLKDKGEMHDNVLLHEPHMALFVANEDPLVFYREIIQFSVDHLKPGGLLFLEIHEKLAAQVLSLISVEKYQQVILKKDMQGRDRIISAVKL